MHNLSYLQGLRVYDQHFAINKKENDKALMVSNI